MQKFVTVLSLSADGQRVGAGDEGKVPCVKIWSAATRKCLMSLEGHEFGVGALAWHPNRTHLVSCGNEHDLQV